jgi:hypothetical protein
MDFGMNRIVVRDGKGAKARVTIRPTVVKNTLTQHLQRVMRQHEPKSCRPRPRSLRSSRELEVGPLEQTCGEQGPQSRYRGRFGREHEQS